MDKYLSRIKQIISLLKTGYLSEFSKAIKRWLWSDTLAIGTLRDLTQPFETLEAKIPLKVRPLEESDRLKFKKPYDPALMARLRWVDGNVGTCYVAVSPDNDPCFMMFLVGSDQNGVLENFFGEAFPRLNPDEALIEGGYTFADFRGMGILPDAMSQIAEKAEEFQATKVFVFANEDNIPALKGCKRSGFYPFMTRHERWRLFRKKTTFTPQPPGTPYSFD